MTRGKLTAYAVVAVFVGVITFLGVRSASGPPVFPGDKLETRTCRQCQGSGTDDDPNTGGRCPFCAGSKNCQVIVPGPNHPVNLRGSVVDAAAFKSKGEAELDAMLEVNDTVGLKPVKGAIGEASLVFQSGSKKIELVSSGNGKFRGAIAPGDYDVTVKKSGYSDTSMKLHVPARSQPIWMEHAKMKMPDPDVVTFVAVMSK